MGEIYEIADLMIKDHEELIDCLDKLKQNIGKDSKLVNELFDKFKEEFTEQRTLYVEPTSTPLDFSLIAVVVVIIGAGYWIYRKKKKK